MLAKGEVEVWCILDIQRGINAFNESAQRDREKLSMIVAFFVYLFPPLEVAGDRSHFR